MLCASEWMNINRQRRRRFLTMWRRSEFLSHKIIQLICTYINLFHENSVFNRALMWLKICCLIIRVFHIFCVTCVNIFRSSLFFLPFLDEMKKQLNFHMTLLWYPSERTSFNALLFRNLMDCVQWGEKPWGVFEMFEWQLDITSFPFILFPIIFAYV